MTFGFYTRTPMMLRTLPHENGQAVWRTSGAMMVSNLTQGKWSIRAKVKKFRALRSIPPDIPCVLATAK